MKRSVVTVQKGERRINIPEHHLTAYEKRGFHKVASAPVAPTGKKAATRAKKSDNVENQGNELDTEE